MVEYSEIDKATAEAEDPKHPGVRQFRAANIVNHYYSFRFLATHTRCGPRTWGTTSPARRSPTLTRRAGATVKPEKPNGIKLEQFVFDVFPLLDLSRFACMEVRREDEFSPLKNARGTGEDDPDTSKRDIMGQGKRWVQAAGATVVSEDPDAGIEVSPLISYVRAAPTLLPPPPTAIPLSPFISSLHILFHPLLFWCQANPY